MCCKNETKFQPGDKVQGTHNASRHGVVWGYVTNPNDTTTLRLVVALEPNCELTFAFDISYELVPHTCPECGQELPDDSCCR